MAKLQTAAGAANLNFDPLRSLWHLLTSVRFALGLIGFLALAALLGVLIPQLPFQMRGNPTAIAAWLELQETRFGPLTDPMYRLGLFDLFRSIWFVGGLAVLVVSVCVCTANRLPPIWRNVTRPQVRVPDEYYNRENLAVTVAVADTQSLIRSLQKRRYKVKTEESNGATYLFADRFGWAQFATFVSHLALILFLAGGLVTMLTARDLQLFVAEGDNGAPVFALSDSDHMQIYVQDAVGLFDETDFPLDFRTFMTVYEDGQEVASGVTTVNHPLKYNGYNFHQSAYFPDGAALRVRDVSTGHVIYDEVLALTSSSTTPEVSIRDRAGNILIEDAIVPTDFIGDASGTLVSVPQSGREFWIGSQESAEGWQLIVFETGVQGGAGKILAPGEKLSLGDLELNFTGMTSVPSVRVTDLPGGSEEGIAEISEGPRGKLLTIGPVMGNALSLSPDQPVTIGGLEYTFLGPREFAGITVRRDSGTILIWLATGTFLLGLGLTFYTPRRRLWGKITSGQAFFRGLGGRSLAIEREIKQAALAAQPESNPRTE